MDSPFEKGDSTREEEFLEGVAVKSSLPGIVPANIIPHCMGWQVVFLK
jgi:hypothetical protein